MTTDFVQSRFIALISVNGQFVSFEAFFILIFSVFPNCFVCFVFHVDFVSLFVLLFYAVILIS